jgi:hypothetical protein
MNADVSLPGSFDLSALSPDVRILGLDWRNMRVITLLGVLALGLIEVGCCSCCPHEASRPRALAVLVPRGATTTVYAPDSKTMESTLYTHPYDVTNDGMCKLPPGVRWMVLPQYRGWNGHETLVDDRITVVLDDRDRSFWPVIVKMSMEEAERLEKQLSRTIAEKKKEASNRTATQPSGGAIRAR